ncbi:MAG TPA: hypothetical protein P5244_10675, partial [Syntrophales bacterium]|nr:hypothetical protein [Syntrophales bacterium]
TQQNAFDFLKKNAGTIGISQPTQSSDVTLLDLNGTADGGKYAFTYGGNTYAVVGPPPPDNGKTNDGNFDNGEILLKIEGVKDVELLKSAFAIRGTAGADSLTGTDGDDFIYGYGGNDTIDGKGGVDTVVYRATPTVVWDASSSAWKATSQAEGTDSLTSVEIVQGQEGPGGRILLVGGGSAYGTIQDAVTAARGGETILVAPGIYTEQVNISGKNGLILKAAGDVTIKSPDNPGVNVQTSDIFDDRTSVIFINNSQNIKLEGFKIDGTDDSATPTPAANIDIFAYKSTGEITSNDVRGFKKGGIYVDGGGINGGSTFAVTNNTSVTGVGATSDLAQNGILFFDGAKGSITGNTVKEIGYISGDWTSTGISLLVAGEGVQVTGNNLTGVYSKDQQHTIDSVGVAVDFSPNAVVTGNTISDHTTGIRVDTTADNWNNWYKGWLDPASPYRAGTNPKPPSVGYPMVSDNHFDPNKPGIWYLTVNGELTTQAITHVAGTDGPDEFYGTQYGDTFSTGGGNDVIHGGAGDDTIIISGSGAVSIDGGAGTDIIKTPENFSLNGPLTLGTLKAETITIDAHAVEGAVTIGTVNDPHQTGTGFGSGGLVGDTVIFTGSDHGNTVYLSAKMAATVTGGAGDDVFMFGGDNDGPAAGTTAIYTIKGGGGNDKFMIDCAKSLLGKAIVTINDFAAGDTTNIYFGTLGDFTQQNAFDFLKKNAGTIGINAPTVSDDVTLLDLNGGNTAGGNVAFTYDGNTYAVVGPSVAAAITTTNDSTFDNHEILIQLVGNFSSQTAALQAAFGILG